jgi:hypothetical protein
MQGWLVPAASFFAALVGAGAAFLGLVWRYRADARDERIRELIREILSAADLATEYWLVDGTAGASQDKIALLEARIIGLVERLEAALDLARPLMRNVDTLGMDIPWARLLDSLTGGDFSVQGRARDTDKAVEVQVAAANLARDLLRAWMRRRSVGQ